MTNQERLETLILSIRDDLQPLAKRANQLEALTQNPKARYTNKRQAELERLVLLVTPEFAKFYEQGNQSAGMRLRKVLQELKVLCQQIRQEVTQIKKSKGQHKVLPGQFDLFSEE